MWREMCRLSGGSERGGVSPDIVRLTEVIATLDRATGRVNRVAMAADGETTIN